MATKQILCRVSVVMEGLPLSFGTAVYLHEVEGWSYDEIADVLGCPIGTVRTKVFRAREVIAEKLRALLDFKSATVGQSVTLPNARQRDRVLHD